MKTWINFSILLLGAGLIACSSYSVRKQHFELLPVTNQTLSEQQLESMIQPYRDSLALEMNKIIAKADTNFIPDRPNGNLNNWIADAVFVNQTKTVKLSTPIMCLLNFGGIRATLNQGNITIGDIFKIAPFDNKIVWVTMPIETLSEIAEYLQKTGGEPLAGATFKNGNLTLNNYPKDAKEFIIITSDYLANGGDKMYFFKKAKEIFNTEKLLRDALIEEATTQQTLISDPNPRIELK